MGVDASPEKRYVPAGWAWVETDHSKAKRRVYLRAHQEFVTGPWVEPAHAPEEAESVGKPKVIEDADVDEEGDSVPEEDMDGA